MNLNLLFHFLKILYLIFLKSHFCWPSFCSLFFLNCNFPDPVLLGLHFLPMSFLHLDFYTCYGYVSLLFFPNFPPSDFALLSFHELLLLYFNIPTLQFIHCPNFVPFPSPPQSQNKKTNQILTFYTNFGQWEILDPRKLIVWKLNECWSSLHQIQSTIPVYSNDFLVHVLCWHAFNFKHNQKSLLWTHEIMNKGCVTLWSCHLH